MEKKESKYPLTFEKIKRTRIKTTEGRKLYVYSSQYSTNKYLVNSLYKPICNLI